VHVLDGRLTPRIFLLQGVVYFLFAPLIALKNRFSDFALVPSHKSPAAVTRCPT
jgi:hypothetical protein